ncbi:alpha/beta fold hydrolase [Egicoccus sp. AB-alg6-2]|uniref:alpha/beta fold hydrolase n=1 Tax=Egicoccus sp. AB-alg6-2 TaxID=3242692 RepID=UPI00359EB772
MLIRRWTVVGHRVLHSRETSDAAVPDARPLILVHGSGTTSRYFRPLLQVLDGRVPASAVELPGIGTSPPVDVPRDVAGLADVLAQWLRATGRHPTTLVGNSMGCQVVTDLAIRHPELVDRLVLIGPTVDRHRRGFFRQAGLLMVDATRERLSLVLTVGTDSALTSRRAAIRYMRAALEHRIEQRLPLVRVPVLIIRGEHDPMVSQRWVEELAAHSHDVSLEVLAGAAHGSHHGRPDAVADLVVSFASAGDEPQAAGRPWPAATGT